MPLWSVEVPEFVRTEKDTRGKQRWAGIRIDPRGKTRANEQPRFHHCDFTRAGRTALASLVSGTLVCGAE